MTTTLATAARQLLTVLGGTALTAEQQQALSRLQDAVSRLPTTFPLENALNTWNLAHGEIETLLLPPMVQVRSPRGEIMVRLPTAQLVNGAPTVHQHDAWVYQEALRFAIASLERPADDHMPGLFPVLLYEVQVNLEGGLPDSVFFLRRADGSVVSLDHFYGEGYDMDSVRSGLKRATEGVYGQAPGLMALNGDLAFQEQRRSPEDPLDVAEIHALLQARLDLHGRSALNDLPLLEDPQ